MEDLQKAGCHNIGDDMSYQYIPELDLNFQKYWSFSSSITVFHIPLTETENEDNLPTGSFLELLFGSTFEPDTYKYIFKVVTPSYLSKRIRERIFFSNTLIKCYFSITENERIIIDQENSNGTNGTIVEYDNIFNLQDDDFTLLDQLMNYRKGLTVDLSNIDYMYLTTALSKLIYQYLDLMVNHSYENLNTSTSLVSSDNLLDNLFESYMVSECNKVISLWSTIIDTGVLEVRPQKDQFYITEQIAEDKNVLFSYNPYNDTIKVYLEGKLLDPSMYVITPAADPLTVTSTTYLDWNTTELEVKEEDIIVIEYYTIVSFSDEGIEKSDERLESGKFQNELNWNNDSEVL